VIVAASPVRLFALARALVCTSCAEALPQRYPSRPPAGLTAAQAHEDQRACVAVAASAKVERAWAYISCLVARGHTVDVAFHVRAKTTYLGVTQTRPHDPAEITTDLANCRATGYAAGRNEGGSREAIADRMEHTFRECLDPCGYVVNRLDEPATSAPR